MLAIQFLGAAGTVTGSRYAITYGQHRFLVDCGMFQGAEEAVRHNFEFMPEPASQYEALVLTHAHIDHCGMIPRLVAEGFKGPILCTFPTRDLCEIMLPDSAKIQEQDADDLAPLYDRDDALDALELMEACDLGDAYKVVDGVRVTFRDSGHIVGSAWLELSFQPLPGWNREEPVRLVFSGDLGRGTSPLLEPPEPLQQADFLVLESTYGDRLHAKTPPEDDLADVINEVSDDGGVLVIPAFAVQRSQELAWLIEELWRKRRIDSLDVFIDSPLAVRAGRVFEEYADHLSLAAEKKVQKSGALLDYPYLKLCESAESSRGISSTRPPMVIISASGMVEGGRVLHHLRRYLPDPRNQVLLAGYQCEGTRGWKLQNGAQELELMGKTVPVRAKVRSLDGLSGHADYAEIGQWLDGLSQPPQQTFLVHGDPGALAAHQAHLQKRPGWRVEIPAHRQEFVLVG